MNRTEKEEQVRELGEIFRNSPIGFLVDFRGLTVTQVTELRRRLREVSTTMRVLKNRLARRAIKDTSFEPLLEQLSETRALVYGSEAVGPAKVVSKFAEEFATFRVLTGLLVTRGEGKVMDAAQIKSLGNLPSRDALLAGLLSVLVAPQSKLVRTLSEIPAQFVRTLAALKEARENA